ncbi:MAG TPA: DMT family transporter [Pseudolabrys sp.]|nr:DMT family transporter [Pseudolabrys sp.]
MNALAVAFAIASALCFGGGLVLTQIGLRKLSPLAGAAISVPSSAFFMLALSPFVIGSEPVHWAAVPIFAAIGLIYPGSVTLITFESNRVLGPVIAGTLGNLAPLFAVGLAFVLLGEPLRPAQLAGLVVVVAGVAVLSSRPGEMTLWRSWYLLLPIAGAVLRGTIQPAMKLGLAVWPSPFAASLVSYIVSALVVLSAARLRTGRLVAEAPQRTRLWFVGVGIVNCMAVLLLYAALTKGPVTLVSPLVATYPLVTVPLSALVLGKSEGGTRLLVAVALTVAGVVLLIVG